MRGGIEELHALIGKRLEDVRGGALLIFTDKRHIRLKVLYFDPKWALADDQAAASLTR